MINKVKQAIETNIAKSKKIEERKGFDSSFNRAVDAHKHRKSPSKHIIKFIGSKVELGDVVIVFFIKDGECIKIGEGEYVEYENKGKTVPQFSRRNIAIDDEIINEYSFLFCTPKTFYKEVVDDCFNGIYSNMSLEEAKTYIKRDPEPTVLPYPDSPMYQVVIDGFEQFLVSEENE